MKTNDSKNFCRSLLLTSLLSMSLSSCSWIDSRRSLFGSEQEDVASAEGMASGETVSKEQFDELTRKYEALLKSQRIEDAQTQQANQMMNKVESEQVIDSDIVAEEISKVKAASELGGTVDVFNQGGGADATSPTSQISSVQLVGSSSYDSNLVEAQITQIRKAEGLVAQNKFDEALTVIKTLEKSPLKQIVVRSKYLLGEILFKQGEYDLSMQIFEEVINKYAFSGLVIKTLGRLIVCSEKLKLAGKQEKYYSILHDFFEQGA